MEWWETTKRHFKSIAIKRSTLLRKLARATRNRLERDLRHLKQSATTGNPSDTEKYLLAKQKLSEFEQQELDAVKLRAKARFAEEGEKSSRYFYSLEKKKQADKRIHSITKDNLDTVTSTHDLLSETRSFYKKLYTAEIINPDAQQSFLDTSILQLSSSDQNSCDLPLSSAELESALKKMEIDKSPGIDGLTSNFYKHFWPLIGPDVTKVFNHSFKHGLLTRSQRRGIITLVFKKGDRSKLQNWRPITLLNTDYKILTKALAIRLTNVLPNIIHSDQTACIPGRTINDNLSLIRDVIDYANETDTPLALISIDQMKAFDRTSHSFLFATLKRFGFGPTFIRWIEVIYNSVSSSVNVNGWLTAFINLERGLRQGCALSMPLYVLTAEILALRIRANPRIQGITPPSSTAQVKLSQYADDTTFTLRDDVSIQETFNLLTLYEAASGAKINLDKCKGLWSGSLKHRTDQLLNFSWYNTYIPEKILGTFFGNTDCTRLNLDRRLQSLRNTIAAWKHRDLSFKGKALVINGLLTSTLWYTLTSVHLPPWAVTELETEIYNFFWDYKKPLTTRDIIALPLAEGGFNVHRLQTKLYALRLNTLRRLISPEPAHWKHFMAYFLRLNSLKLGLQTARHRPHHTPLPP